MHPIRLIYRSLTYFWKPQLAVIVGVAICSMVITGTLIVGDSIRSSLEVTTQLRLGHTEYLFSSTDRYFRTELANEINSELKIDIAPILQLNGIASSQGGKLKLNNVQVIGIDNQFQAFTPGNTSLQTPADKEVYISENLAQRLQLKVDDPMLLRIDKASQIPKNAPFVTDQENQISIRLKVAKILTPQDLGRFNLKTSQTAPFNAFISLSFLNGEMELSGKANKLLFHSKNSTGTDEINTTIQKYWRLEDMALELKSVLDSSFYEINSKRVFIDSTITSAIKSLSPNAESILTYMINSFELEGKGTPYSFMAAGPFSEEGVTINTWMAKDLNAQLGDSIKVSYYVIGPLRQLDEKSSWFTISNIVDMDGIFADQALMPDLPGMSDAGNCRDWEAGVPIELDKIRDKDEDYWNKYRGTPKAFINYNQGKALWHNRFGIATAIRIPVSSIQLDSFEAKLAQTITPASQGFSLKSVKVDGLVAARSGVDFGQLFMALSFFILVAGMILMALLFNLHLEKRMSEMGTLKAIGFTQPGIRNLFLIEGVLIALPGAIIGGGLAIAYNKAIFYALNTVWYDIVMTDILQEVIQAKTLALGIIISTILVSISIWFNIRKKLQMESTTLQRRLVNQRKTRTFWLRFGAWFSAIIGFGLLIYEGVAGQSLNTGIFFGAGGLLMISFLLFFLFLLRTPFWTTHDLSISMLVFKNLTRNQGRSFRIVTLFTLGTFIIISTGLNKKDLHKASHVPTSGTGGFEYFMETTLPVLTDLNNPQNTEAFGIEEKLEFVQLRKSPGDDASCLNLNRIVSPRILGVPTEQLSGRFSFVSSTEDLDVENPWFSLKKKLPGDVVPAILDQTVIQWGLGKKVGDTLVYLNEAGEEMKIKIIGGLANSIFQGNALIDNALFLENFPSNSGSYVFLIEGEIENTQETKDELLRAFRNNGIEIQGASERLAMFNQVENTYLSIFLLLGGLAMILGTVGLGISLARNILDRGQEIGILRAMGYCKNKVMKIITYEHLILLLTGTMAGTITAFIATLPSILSDFVQASWQTAALIVVLILLNGFAWIYGITMSYLKKDLLVTLREE